MVAPASDLLGYFLKSFILLIGLPEMKKISRPTTCTSWRVEHDRVRHERTDRLRCEPHGRVFKLVESWRSG